MLLLNFKWKVNIYLEDVQSALKIPQKIYQQDNNISNMKN